jgi:hypothetical protein
VAGTGVSLDRNCPLPIAAGDIELTGTAVDLVATRKIAAESKALTLSGQSVGLRRDSFVVSAGSGAVELAGTAVDLSAQRKISASSGAIAFSGTAVGFKGKLVFHIDSGAIGADGQDVALFASRKVAAGTKAFALSGKPITLLSGRKVDAASGLLEITGTDVSLNLKQPKKLLINPAVLTVVGNDIDLRYWLLSADSKPLLLSGSDVSLLKARGVWVQTVFSHTAGRNTVSAEKVRRVTAQPRITGV